MPKPLLLDLFCCAGGASKGYVDAGFKVVGIDIDPQPNYPFEFYQADAIAFLDVMIKDGFRGIDAIHASPPCQRWSQMSNCNPGLKERYPDLIAPVRERLLVMGLPFVIENVEGAPLENPVILCGSQFGLTTFWTEVDKLVALQRHRGFECHGFTVPDPGPHDHTLRSVSVAGGGVKHFSTSKGGTRVSRDLMGIDWTNKAELNEAIPPPYTTYIGSYIMQALEIPVAA